MAVHRVWLSPTHNNSFYEGDSPRSHSMTLWRTGKGNQSYETKLSLKAKKESNCFSNQSKLSSLSNTGHQASIVTCIASSWIAAVMDTLDSPFVHRNLVKVLSSLVVSHAIIVIR
ncbi:hypothetical protein CEXT_604871 [Caerostris extrusa]|uniref:Uncharacterized protein n=1 Tax=Caerostris extrusa TaxID=172846 RepID=A0AAV4S8V9_CAEEX|nr:hypothetical protein CEXT_604871 [Caerostris extrusa]